MKIRKFRKTDARKVSNILRKTQCEVLDKYYPRKVISAFCRENTTAKILEKSKTVNYFVAEDKNKLVGFVGIKGNWIKTLHVIPSSHGKGVGKKLVKYVDKLSMKRGIKTLFVNSSIYAEPFYKKCGFIRVRQKTAVIDGTKYKIVFMKKMVMSKIK